MEGSNRCLTAAHAAALLELEVHALAAAAHAAAKYGLKDVEGVAMLQGQTAWKGSQLRGGSSNGATAPTIH